MGGWMMSLGVMDEVDSEARPLHSMLSDTCDTLGLAIRPSRMQQQAKCQGSDNYETYHTVLATGQVRASLHVNAVHDEHVGQRKSSTLL